MFEVSRRRVAFAAGVLCLSAGMLAGCRESQPKPPRKLPASPVRTAVLQASGACTVEQLRTSLLRLQALERATSAYAAEPTVQARDTARAAFREAMASWQVLEMLRFGPAARRTAPGGRDLRAPIYSWPLVSRCAVEETLASNGYLDPGLAAALVNRRGLAAVEYLLFEEGEDTACPATSPIVASGSWAALTSGERAARRRTYARVAAEDVRVQAQALLDAWEPRGGDFLSALGNAGADTTVFTTNQAALNAVSDALFYVEHEVKDMKLARPLGLRDCAASTCPEWLESPFAGLSKENVRNNLEGFRRIFEGCGEGYAGTGFDDLLEAVNAGPMAARLLDAHRGARAALDALEEPDLREALGGDPASVRALYDAVKALTDLLKTEFITALDLELPMSLEGDND